MAPDIKDIVGTSASICTILQFFTGILVCQTYVRNGTTGDSSSFPFVAGFLSSSLWLRYGFLLGNKSLIIVNTIGAALQLAYVVTFYLYTINKSALLKQLGVVVAVILAVMLYAAYEPNLEVATFRIGLFSSMMTIMFFAAPLTMLAHVIQTKSAAALPFVVILATFIVSAQWLVYGIMLGDRFMQIPNALGCVLSSFQLLLFVIYPS